VKYYRVKCEFLEIFNTENHLKIADMLNAMEAQTGFINMDNFNNAVTVEKV
jgi:hypothetical protein